ncbi:MAG: polymerase, sigma 70 subunit, RpoD subfamily, partial [Modestobacter sp.]|nr:polymerase, sigma 70 subunit, RpoD subfamily [Modestobacter sp.]
KATAGAAVEAPAKPADAAEGADVSTAASATTESEEIVWDEEEEESEALRQARKDAEMTASADSVRAYLKQIGKVALLNAEEEVDLAKRI